MINKINTLRATAKNLTSHLCLEGKTKITKPGLIIPGAIAMAGTVVTLETKDNNADLIVQKDNDEIQRASFNYDETPDGYRLLSATSTYFYDDKDNKEIRQNHYVIEPGQEKSYEHSINYADAPVRKTTRAYIDKINSSIAQTAGYKSDKTVYDDKETHIYGEKSLGRDIPALSELLNIIAPKSKFVLKMKDKLKKDNKTSLFAFEANNAENGNEILRGFMSTNGDSVSYRLNTEGMIIIGEQSSDKDLSNAYLKSKNTKTEQKETKADAKNEELIEETAKNNSDNTQSEQTSIVDTPPKEKVQKKQNKNTVSGKKPRLQKDTTDSTGKEINEVAKQNAQNNISKSIITTHPELEKHPLEYYSNLIVETATNDGLPVRKKAESYKNTLGLAYLAGFSQAELENVLKILGFSDYCRKQYVGEGIALANKGTLRLPVKTLNDKIKELKNVEINIDDEDIVRCVKNMIADCVNIQDAAAKEKFVDKALNLFKNSTSETIETDTLLFMQETGKINDEMGLHYEIYMEIVNDKKAEALRAQIEKMINNLSDSNYHKQRDEFFTQLYIAKELNELEQLQTEIQKLLNDKSPKQTAEKPQPKERPAMPSIGSLTSTNRKLVKKLLTCKSPSDISLSFDEMRNLILGLGFVESNVRGTHHKFIPPMDIYFNGVKQSYITLSSNGVKTQNPAQIDDLINICKQYFRDENL